MHLTEGPNTTKIINFPATHVRQSAAAEVQYADTWVAGSVFPGDHADR